MMFDNPAIKVHSSDLVSCISDDNGKWTIKYQETSVAVGMVWLQGTVISVEPTGAVLKDSTGYFEIQHNSSIPGSSFLGKGAAVSVIAELVVTKPQPKLQAIKIMNISDNTNLQKIWDSEVEDYRNFMSKKVIPKI